MRKINVLQFICSTGFYGAERWILALAKNLDPASVNCQLAVTRESADQDLEIFKRYQTLGLAGYFIPMKGRFDPGVILKLTKLIQKNQIDIIHTHGYKSDILGLIAAKMAGVKSVATPHGFENVKDFKLQLFIRMGCLSLKYFDKVVPLSDELKSDMQRIKIEPNRLRLIRNGVDLEEVETERKRHTPAMYNDVSEKRIGYVGQMAYRKNIGDLIKAFDLLCQTHNNVRLILIGDGPQKPELEELARSTASFSKIEFLGYREDRLRILKEMDLFSMTSSLEGIPRCMMEAMALGIPVAAYNIPGVDNLIVNEKTGLTAEFGHVEDLKNCWERLLFDRQFFSKIAQNGRKHIVENFSARRMAEEYTSLYGKMLRKR